MIYTGDLDDADEALAAASREFVLYGYAINAMLYLAGFRAQLELERGDLAAARRALRPEDVDDRSTDGGRYWLGGEIAVRLAEGRDEDVLAAVDDYERRYGELAPNPATIHWRGARARALARLGRTDDALAEIETELEVARGFGAPGTVCPLAAHARRAARRGRPGRSRGGRGDRRGLDGAHGARPRPGRSGRRAAPRAPSGRRARAAAPRARARGGLRLARPRRLGPLRAAGRRRAPAPRRAEGRRLADRVRAPRGRPRRGRTHEPRDRPGAVRHARRPSRSISATPTASSTSAPGATSRGS